MKIFDFIKNDQSNVEGVGFAKMAAFTFVVSIINNVLALIVSIIAARMLGPEGKGILTIIIMYPTFLYTLGHLSVYRALTIHIAEKKFSFSNFPATVLVFIAGMSIFLVSVFVFGYFNFNKYFIQNVDFSLILIALCIIPCSIILQTFTSILQAKGRMIEFNLNGFIFNCFVLICIVVLLAVFKLGVKGGVYAYVISNVLICFVLINFVRKISHDKWKFNAELLKKLVSDGLKLHLGIIAYYILLRIDMLMLGYYRQASSVGYYSIAVSMADVLIIIPTVIMHVFYSKVPDFIDDKMDMAKKMMLVYKHSLFFLVAAAVFLALVAKPLIMLFYGDKFLPSIIPFLILLPGVCFFRQNNMFSFYLVGMKRFFVISIVASLGCLINIILNCIFIPKYDFIGAAIASVITYFIVGIIYFFVFLHISKIKAKEFFKNLIIKKEDLLLYKTLFK